MPPAVEVPLQLWGGLDTEMSATDLPEGLAPACNDVAFLPGSLFSRPGANRLYPAINIAGTPVYFKTYIQPNNAPLNLILTTEGYLYSEDPVNAPGVLSVIGTGPPGCRAYSTTAFGREYIALSDPLGQHGYDKPLQFDGTYLDPVSQYGPGSSPSIASVPGASVLMAAVPNTLSRTNNVVTCWTATPHGLKVGYQAQITNTPASQRGGGIQFIVINNEDNPGVATVNTNSAHGLLPGNYITMTGIDAGGGPYNIASINRVGGIATVTMAENVTWAPGAVITILNADPSANTTTPILEVTSATQFTYASDEPDAQFGAAGQVALNWPIPQTASPNYYEVQTAPSPNSFTVNVSYSDGVWGGGIVYFAWDGIYFVTAVLNPTEFQYQQYGPSNSISQQIGTVTAYGQAAPGIHQMQVLFQTRQGYLTKPSPPVQFIANGGQYLSVTNIPIGPPNVIARILAFAGAGGDYFFYIPVPALINGQVVSTSTVVSDNSTTTALLDFSDDTLFAASGINIAGNNLNNLVVLGPSLGVFSYANRLLWWGNRNIVTNLQNLDFAGGYLPSNPTYPTGWNLQAVTVGGGLAGPLGIGGLDSWRIVGDGGTDATGLLFQPAFEDALGIPILTPNTAYNVRLLIVSPTGGTGSFVVDFYSPTVGVLAHGQITMQDLPTGAPDYITLSLGPNTPLQIPADTQLRIYLQTAQLGTTVQFTNIEVFYSLTPYNTFARASYVNNPESFDGVSGDIGPEGEPVITAFEIRDSLYFLGPTGLHETADSADAEPGDWGVRQVATDCGGLGIFGVDVGEDFAIWASPSGLRGFSGGVPAKLSQEIQPLWQQINQAATSLIVVKNDAIFRRIYIAVPTGTNTTANLMYVLDYRENDTMQQIIAAAPVRISYSGRMISSDLGRKWTIWNLPMVTMAEFYNDGRQSMCFGGATNIYSLSPAKLTDDDFGQFYPSYTTYGFVNHDQEAGLGLGSQRKLYKTINIFATGVGNLQITPLIDQLNNPQVSRPLQMLSQFPVADLSWGLNTAGERVFFQIAVLPLYGQTDVSLTINKMMVRIMAHPMSPKRSAL